MSFKANLETQYKGKLLELNALPALPVTLQQAMSIMQQPNADIRKVANVFAQDLVLSAKVLKLVNSSVYGFPGRIVSIQNALTLLGFNIIRSVIISTVVMENMPKHMKGLWTHSMAVAVAAKTIANFLKIKESNEYSLAGLLHDLGKVILATQMPDAAAEINALVAARDLTYIEAEREVLGMDHTQINAWVAQNWHLPPNLTAAMTFHHAPLETSNYTSICCVVHLANFMARLFERGDGGDTQISHLDPRAIKHLGIDQRALRELVDLAGAAMCAEGEDGATPRP